MKLLKITTLVLAIVGALMLPGRAADPDNSQKPNIVIILSDDQGIMDTSVPFLTDEAGKPKRYPLNEYNAYPEHGAVGRTGHPFQQLLRHERVLAQPGRQLMTGQNSARHHVTNWIHPLTNNAGPHGPPNWNWNRLTKEDVTLPRLLKKAGYRTIEVGKGHFGPYGSEGGDPRNLGFATSTSRVGHGARRPPTTGVRATATPVVPPIRLTGPGKGHVPPCRGWRSHHGTPTHLTEALTLVANEQITDAVHAHQPFFLYLSHYAPHAADNHQFENDPRFARNYNKWELTPVGHTWMEVDALILRNARRGR